MQKRRPIRSGMNKSGFSRPQTIKLSISVGIFLALVLIKLFDPTGAAQLSGAVDVYIGDDTPSTFQAMGQVITDGGNLIEVFKNLSAVLTGSVKEDEPIPVDDNVTDDIKQPEATPTPAIAPTASTAFFSDGNDEVITDTSYDTSEVPVVYEGELISGGGFGVDDTLPLPFGYDAPPNVDFTMHTFSFDYTSPLKGVITSTFGYRNHPTQNEQLFHYGVDIAANKGTNIAAFADGIVTNTGKSTTYGNYALVSHGGGVSTFYAHCNKILVKEGAKVTKGQAIAQVGSTGNSTGPHLHFEVRLDSKLLDPVFYIPDVVNEQD